MTTIDTTAIEPLAHREAMRLQAREVARTLVLLRSLDDTDWAAATDCPAWDVRAMYLHVLGACEAGASVRENLHQQRVARADRRRHGGSLEAALSGLHVRERAGLGPTDIVERLAAIAPKMVRGRTRTPGWVRDHVTLAIDGPVHESWKLGYFVDTIYLRDLWMHRVDASHAVGRRVELSADHDGRIVADVVAEWARRHKKPFVLELGGPAGGTYAHQPQSATAAHVVVDAVDFCRTLAGRLPASGLLATVVPF